MIPGIGVSDSVLLINEIAKPVINRDDTGR